MGFISSLMDLVFPPRCVFCKKHLKPFENGVCKACLESLDFTSKWDIRHGEYFKTAIAPLYYEDKVRQSIIKYKFHGNSFYGKAYGKFIAKTIEENYKKQYDYITWVPLSPERLKKRGYDQAMLLALSTAFELSDVAIELLVKTNDNTAMSSLKTAEERYKNISGVYKIVDPELIENKRILIIDDIITTGSTLDECAKTLIEGGAKEVICASLAMTRQE